MLVNPFKKAKGLAHLGSRDFVAFEMTGTHFKIVHFCASLNKQEVLSVVQRPIAGLADDEIARAIRTVFIEMGLKNPTVVSVIASHSVITKNIEVPSTDPEEIRGIISLQAGRHTPYSREEIIADYVEIGTYKSNYTKILLVIVSRQVVKKQFDLLERAGIRLEKVLLSAEGIAWGTHKILKADTESHPLACLHIDETSTDFVICYKGRPLFLRSIPIGAQALSVQKELSHVKFVEELKRSLEAYHSEDIEKSPTQIIVTGALTGAGGIQEALSNSIHLPVKTVEYEKQVGFSQAASAAQAASVRISFFEMIAVLFAFDKLKVDLTPEEVKVRKLVEERGRDLIRAGIFVLSIFVLICSIFLTKIYFKGVYLKKLDTRYQSLNLEARKLESDFAKISQIKNFLSSRGLPLEVLAELYVLIPDTISLSDIRYDDQGRFSLKGTAESMSAVYAFVDSLEKAKYYKEVKTKYTTKRKEDTKDVTDFEVASLVKKKGDGK